MSDATPNPVPEKTQSFVETQVDGERVLMQVDNGYFFTLNETSELIWTSIDGKKTLSEIAQTVSEGFDVSVEECRTDVKEFIDKLVENDLAKYL